MFYCSHCLRNKVLKCFDGGGTLYLYFFGSVGGRKPVKLSGRLRSFPSTLFTWPDAGKTSLATNGTLFRQVWEESGKKVGRGTSSPICSICGKHCSCYDTLKERRFEFVPLWGIAVFFVYSMRRVNCKKCGIVVETVPWATGNQHLTTTYAWFLASWAKKMSWKEVAVSFKTTWDHVFQAVELAVKWGLANRDLNDITAIGVDEVQWHIGHKYLTVVYQINNECKRLLWVPAKRTKLSRRTNRQNRSLGSG